MADHEWADDKGVPWTATPRALWCDGAPVSGRTRAIRMEILGLAEEKKALVEKLSRIRRELLAMTDLTLRRVDIDHICPEDP